jgi:carboxyl-terminal processing protease
VQNFTVTRDKIPSYSVDVAMMIDQQTGYIKVTRFAANTYAEFKEAMTKLKSKGMKRLLLDLRDNPGGYMDKAVGMVDELVGGNAMIVYQDGKGSRFDSESRAKVNGIFEKGAVIVLINEGSASASEIIAGALQDNDRALVVGRRSFGKGLVQLPIDLSDGSELRLTISRYYTPSGRSIQKPFAAYEEDMKRRYDKGEFFYEDSIKLDKSKTYKTRKGRTVYGGGGIMPDIFVPMDTGKFTYLNQLFQENIIREYAFNYYNDNKATLSKMKYEDFKQSFKVTEKMLNQITEMGRKANITADPLSIQASQKLIQMHTKALIARSIWKNEGFYPIIFEEDEVFQEAIKHFAEADKIVN